MAKVEQIRVASATGISSSSNISGDDDLAARIHDAMQQAVRECLDKGILDPDEQRERMLAARDAVMGE